MKTSKGEERIINILKKENIKFEKEKTFKDLKNGKYRFDFYIPYLKVCIEYDGPQHFKQVKYFQKTRQDFLKQQEHDRQKNSYCLANNIFLYRIPYWEIENINSFRDLLNEKWLVRNKWHNDIVSDRRTNDKLRKYV